jgi:hypothetical protein
MNVVEHLCEPCPADCPCIEHPAIVAATERAVRSCKPRRETEAEADVRWWTERLIELEGEGR